MQNTIKLFGICLFAIALVMSLPQGIKADETGTQPVQVLVEGMIKLDLYPGEIVTAIAADGTPTLQHVTAPGDIIGKVGEVRTATVAAVVTSNYEDGHILTLEMCDAARINDPSICRDSSNLEADGTASVIERGAETYYGSQALEVPDGAGGGWGYRLYDLAGDYHYYNNGTQTEPLASENWFGVDDYYAEGGQYNGGKWILASSPSYTGLPTIFDGGVPTINGASGVNIEYGVLTSYGLQADFSYSNSVLYTASVNPGQSMIY